MRESESHNKIVKKSQPRTVSFTVPSLPKPQLRRPRIVKSSRLLIAIAFLLTSVLAGYLGAKLERNGNDFGLNTTKLNGQSKIVTSESQLISQIAKDLSPSVVSVNVSVTTTTPGDSFGFFEVPPQEQEAVGAGTGIIISSKGIVITNRHVVPEGTTSVSVTLSDGTELKNVTVIGRTNENDSLDIAFLKINDTNGHNLVPAPIGDSSAVEVGDNVVAIGNALGQFQNSVTSGIVSGYGRSIQTSDSEGGSESLADLIQTDAAINSGNSGGPLVNLNGQVIGINTAVAGGGAENIGFAIAINDVKGIIGQILKTGKFARPYLGVRYVALTADVAYEYNLPVNRGAYIAPTPDGSSSILEGSPADKAGLKEKDIITEIDGIKIDQKRSLVGLLGQHAVGDKVSITVVRGDKTIKLDAVLEAVPANN